MKPIDAYRLALTEELTVKEAAFKYGIKPHTLWTAGYRAKLPMLVTRHGKRRITLFKGMDNAQLYALREKLNKEIESIDQEFHRRTSI